MDLRERVVSESARHPWEVRRSELFRALLEPVLAHKTAIDVLDCGAGDGWFSSRLRKNFPQIRSVTCWDAHYDDATLERLRAQYPELSFSRTKPEGACDLVIALDVMEHVEDDVAFVRDLAGSIAPGGSLVVSVPAWQPLFGRHDRFLRHYRRYRPARCKAVLTKAGLRVIADGGAFHSLLLPRAAAVLAEHAAAAVGRPLPPASDATWNHGKTVTSLVDTMLRADNAVSRATAKWNIQLPGLSYWAVAVTA